MSNASMFQDENARFQVRNGSGEDITASAALADPSVVIGRGIYIPQWRDFTWQHIARVERQGDEIVFVYLTTSDTQDNGREGNVSREITISTVVEATLRFADGDQVLVSKAEVARPKGRRHGKIITWVNEELPE